jgi:hypothetical protein
MLKSKWSNVSLSREEACSTWVLKDRYVAEGAGEHGSRWAEELAA